MIIVFILLFLIKFHNYSFEIELIKLDFMLLLFCLLLIIYLATYFICPIAYAIIPLGLFAMLFGGCVGDMYVIMILLKSPNDMLMIDTGPTQKFYKKEQKKNQKRLISF